MNFIVICECRPQVFEFCHVFTRFISYSYIVVLSCVQMTRHNHVLRRPLHSFLDQHLYQPLRGFLCSLLWYLCYRPSKVCVGKLLSDKLPILNGLKQGDALSSLLSKFALEYAIRKVQEKQVGFSWMRHISYWFILTMLIWWMIV
jgi:hypothetical protein